MSSMSRKIAAIGAVGGVVLGTLAYAPSAIGAPPDGSPSDLAGNPGAVAALWTPEARAAAIPRDLVIDQRGLGYLKRPDGTLEPYGHPSPAQAQPPVVTVGSPVAPSPVKGKPGGGGGDSTAPDITGLDPNGQEVGSPYTLSATVTDASDIRNATVYVAYAGSSSYSSFRASNLGGDTWGVTLAFNTAGVFSWYMEAKDTSNNTGTSAEVDFTVNLSGGGSGGPGGGSGGVVTNTEWTAGGTVQTAAGRIYFEMPTNKRQNRWTGYVCSGTAVTDSSDGRSTVLTAAHCVYDDANKAFARNVLFIPDQAGTSGSGTDTNCSNDPYGCWVPDFGVVDKDWTTRTFPSNIPWDYGYYVIKESGSDNGHVGSGGNVALDSLASMAIDFAGGAVNENAAALGYSYSDDPNFMYCSQPLATESSYGDWWLGDCGLSGGASGGPWLDPVNGTSGKIISVNSWGYSNQPGMAGPRLSGSAQCVYDATAGTPSDRGIVATC